MQEKSRKIVYFLLGWAILLSFEGGVIWKFNDT